MLRVRNVIYLFLCLLFLVSISHGATETLINGSNIPLVTGDSYLLYQGYMLTLKSVSGNSVWLQLAENDKIVKSEVVPINGYFIYNKINRTILSVKVENIYSGSPEQNLVSLFPVYQFIDYDMPLPQITNIIPENTPNPGNGSAHVRIYTPKEPLIWALGIVLILFLFYALRKLW